MSEPAALDLSRLKAFPLEQRRSLTSADEILLDPDAAPRACDPDTAQVIADCVEKIRAARKRGATVMLIYGAHLLRNGTARILERLFAGDWLTHLATNGAGTIHDWEYAWHGRSTESVRENVATGTFGTWDETARAIYLALHAGALRGEGYGQALGRLIVEDGVTLPTAAELEAEIRRDPANPLTPARSSLLVALRARGIPEGRTDIIHRWKHASIIAQAFQHGIPLTVHPGIGYDIIANHPWFDGAVIGRGATTDFAVFGAAVDRLDGGVVLNVGSAIMGPQVFEKSLSCVHNLRFQENRQAVAGHSIYVVDLQDGGRWDWRQGEPPKTNPAYYLRFCKTYARMGGEMQYLSCDNAQFVHHLHWALNAPVQREVPGP